MGVAVGVVSLLLMLVLVGRGLPLSRWPAVLAATLAVILLVVAIEQMGWWPVGWHTR